MGRLCTRRSPIYAIVRTGGKQYRVEPSQVLDVERLPNDIGSRIDFGVLLLGGDGETAIGTPLVEGAKVVAEVIEHGRDKKIVVFKYKNKTRYRRRHGHRQEFTRLEIKQIVTASGNVIQVEEKPRKPRASKADEAPEASAVSAVEAPAEEAAEEAPPRAKRAPSRASRADIPEVEAEAKPPARARRARKAQAEDEGPADATNEAAAEAEAADEEETSEDKE